MKTRVWELAKELNLTSKELMKLAQTKNIELKNHLASISKEEEKILRGLAKAPKKEKEQEKKESRKKTPKNTKKKEAESSEKATSIKHDKAKHKHEPSPNKKQIKPKEIRQENAPAKGKDNKKQRHTKPEAKESKPSFQNNKNKDQKQKPKQKQHSNNDNKSNAKPAHSRPTNNSRHNNRFNNNRQDFRNRGRNRKKQKERRKDHPTAIIQKNREYEVVTPITVKDLSQVLGIRSNDIIKTLFASYSMAATINQSLDADIIEAIALEFDKKVKIKQSKNLEQTVIEELEEMEDREKDLELRGPVVTFLGHVDHGKTSLLDKIRNTKVTQGEAGGITQHIGAYKVPYKKSSIVFLDTPGHEAFTSMRARGANVTDIVVLVVAADDGVMPQTVEAINHAKAAEVPIIVALNKIDKEGSKPEATIQQLTKYNLIPDEWGGDTVFVKVSAITGAGIDELLEYIALVAEMQSLEANPKRKASGTVLEGKVKDGKGSVATLLVQNGTLKRGDFILCGGAYGRVRDIIDHTGRTIKQAGPSTPIEISGISDLPEAGDKFYVVKNLSQAKSIAEERKKNLHEKNLEQGSRKLSIHELMKQIQQGETKELNIILKADVQGSLEALTHKLSEISHDEVKVKVLHAAAGGINETDIQLAEVSQALVIGFNVTPSKAARDMSEDKGVEIRRYSVIYHLLDSIRDIMTGMLDPDVQEKITGHITIRKVIRISRLGNIAGCYVTDGTVSRNSKIRISRNGVVMNKEKPLELLSLKHHKDDVAKVKQGFECGIRLHGFDDFKEGDEMEAFEMVEIQRKLD
ncbi:translation initiation factor IF-2 [Candidatus Uabimicrobium amorphum]|uniref:Translation initiation factor IF-2 n=1 Tax=Uabimicrobium amorphum TaxID=2596890 RepID=A0A5S9F655_UABAM|nr:translation initiation factor IF-2 [Candidatus Uabimicrobium amorphum]BBM87547.1 translation initiation factor IF-2 [Candidatus Uabimicrobium amorphum]